jgi:hypothetical protein
MLEVTIRDVAVAALKSRQIDTKALVELAKTPNNSGGLRCFVQGVRVASIIYKKFSRIGVDASIAVSELFKSGNSYFGSSNAFSGDFKLSLDCIDLDVLAPKVSGSQLEESDEDLLADPDRFRPARGRLAVGALPTR